MTNQEVKEAMLRGWDLLFSQAAIIAELPLEEWLKAFSRAESIAPIVDPTLYRKYLYSGKGEIIKDVIEAALTLKKAILKARVDSLALEIKNKK